MSANIGRKLLIKRGSTVIAGIRAKTISFGGEPVDITTDDDNGFRTLLAEAGQKKIDLSFEGVTKDNLLRQATLGANPGELLLTDVNILYPNGDTLSGNFFLTQLEETGNYNDAIKFSGSLQSSGEWTYVAV